jgi:hypothetical protein
LRSNTIATILPLEIEFLAMSFTLLIILKYTSLVYESMPNRFICRALATSLLLVFFLMAGLASIVEPLVTPVQAAGYPFKNKTETGKTSHNCPTKHAGLIDRVWSIEQLLTFPYHKITTVSYSHN